MKSVVYSFNKKLVCISLFVICYAFSSLYHAQVAVKSTNITVINGKKYYLHKVAHAQSLYGISKIYNIDVNAILAENPGASKGIIVGQDLRIPFDAGKVAGTSKPAEQAKPVEKQAQKTEEPKPEESKPQAQETAASNGSNTQEPDLLSMVEDNTKKKEKEFATSTFKSTRNINFHTSEILGRRCLDFRISHRFGPLNTGANNAWGIDGPANLMLSLEYSHTGRWMVGISRCIENKTAEGFFKWKIFRQAKHGCPVTITYFGGVYHTFVKDPLLGEPVKFYNNVADRLSFVNEIIIARKVTPWLSLQVAPAYVHYNLVGDANGLSKNDCFAITGVIRAKYNKRQAIIFEYAYRLNTNYAAAGNTYYNSMGIGWEVETGGHVFQIFATNSYGIMENSYLMTTNTSWKASGVRIGFNITRVFALSKKSEL
jgi:LysM repeat protein